MQAPAYDPAVIFQEEETDLVSGRSTVRTSALDAELAAIATSIAALITNATAIQRDDTELLDGIVKLHTLSTEVLALLGSGGFTINDPIGWLTATNYAARSIVKQGTGTYVAVSTHTSGVFATDLAAGKWVLIFDSASFVASAVAFTPTGDVSSANVQAAVAEVDSEKLAKAANLSDVQSAQTTRSNLSVHSKAENQQAAGAYAVNTGSGDALIAAFVPVIADLSNTLRLSVKATAPNTITEPTFTPNDGVVTPKKIVKFNDQLLVPGDISGSGHTLDLLFDVTLDKWRLLNPAYDPTLPDLRGTDVAAAATLTIPDNGNYFYITGTGVVTALSSKPAGARITLRFVTGAVTLTPSANVILQDDTAYAPGIDDLVSFRSEGGGVWSEESRRELPPRVRVGAKLALAQLAR